MERTAITPPRECFGLEQHPGNPLCPSCQHRNDCADLMGHLVDRVNVDEVRFTLMPPKLAEKCPKGSDPDIPNLENVYGFCYEWVFKKKARGNIGKDRDIILERVQEAGTSVKLFLLANMLGWKQSHAEDFYPRTLTGDFAVNQVKTFASACNQKYGTFDVTTLDELMGSDVAQKDFEGHLLNSEIIAGTWIVNYKLFRSGGMASKLYAEKETALHPYWLAIEDTYYRCVLEHSRNQPCSELIRKHRWNTIQTLAKLKRHTQNAIAVFRARERIMPEAVRRVLAQRGLRTEHFQIEDVPVTDTFKFWAYLGIAIQHYEYLKFVDNCPSIFDRI